MKLIRIMNLYLIIKVNKKDIKLTIIKIVLQIHIIQIQRIMSIAILLMDLKKTSIKIRI